MKKKQITFTLSENTIRDLYLYVNNGEYSRFVEQSLKQNLELRKAQLAKEFLEANEDEERNNEIEIWDRISGDGLNDTNIY